MTMLQFFIFLFLASSSIATFLNISRTLDMLSYISNAQTVSVLTMIDDLRGTSLAFDDICVKHG